VTSPAGGRLGAAFVRIRADVSQFATDARRGIQNGINAAAARLNTSALVNVFRRAGTQAGQNLGNGVYRGADGRLRDLRGRFVSEGALAGQLYASAFNRTAELDERGGLALGNLSVLMNKFVLGAAAAAKALPVVIALVAELGQVGIALAASLPFLITSVLIIKETFSSAFRGVGDAIKAAMDQDPGKLQAALKELTPSARAFVLEISKVAPVFEKIQKSIQESFFEPLKGSFAALAKSSFFTELGRAMQTIANEAGFIASQILAIFKASADSGQFQVILAQVVQLFVTLATIFAPLTSTFLNLAAAAGPFVNLLAGRLADRVLIWLDAINASIAGGTLAQTFETALAVMGDFFELLGSIGSILGSVFGALSADGESVIATIGGLAKQFADFLKSTEGLAALSTLADILHLIGSTITLILAPVLPVLAELITAVGGPLVEAFRTLGPPLAKVIDALTGALLPVIEQLAPVFALFVETVAGVLAEVLILIADEIYELTPAFVQLFETIGPAAVTIVEALGLVLQEMVPLLPLLFEALEELIPVFVEALPLIEFFATVLAGVLIIIAALVEILVPFVGALAQFGAEIAAFVLDDFLGSLMELVEWIGNAYDAVAEFFGEQLPALIDGGQREFSEFGDTLSQFPAMIANALSTLAGVIVQPFTVGFDGVRTTVGTGIGRLAEMIRGIPGLLGSFVGSIGAAAANIGRAIGNGLANIPGFAVDIGRRIVDRIRGFANDVIGDINRGINNLDRLLPFDLPRIPFLARGAIINKPMTAVLGEAGREVVIPLTDPARARQLAVESGLLDLLGGGGLGGAPPVYVHVYLGDEEIMSRVDSRVGSALDDQARELTFGSRGV
jgi:phage-related protein